ncbi:MAG: hypothetical protein LBG15_08240 [Dysgonamonadaceae bacterium]|jgi:hypothetical protein|nr:hypothetical protein [Dysgonamonadaceae bacterium]
MELKDFVKETLTQIIDGVKEAQKDNMNKGAIINPAQYENANNTKQARSEGKVYPVQDVDFEIGLEISEIKESKAGIGVAVGIFSTNGNKGQSKGNASVTNVRFTIPVAFPVVDEGRQITNPITVGQMLRSNKHYY